jgi:hypothetical protein
MPFSVQISLAQALNASSSAKECLLQRPQSYQEQSELGMTQEKSRDMQRMSTSNTEMRGLCEPPEIAGMIKEKTRLIGISWLLLSILGLAF